MSPLLTAVFSLGNPFFQLPYQLVCLVLFRKNVVKTLAEPPSPHLIIQPQPHPHLPADPATLSKCFHFLLILSLFISLPISRSLSLPPSQYLNGSLMEQTRNPFNQQLQKKRNINCNTSRKRRLIILTQSMKHL